ncbi:MAG: hypothetical protein JSW64_05315 [Candidatus Zixiibacteriota bacterium]|nr:MAG: hypothetical protein JSW64_05315 [candidate division Zixibacteria bacterium]
MKKINHLIFLTIYFSMILLYNCSREKTTSNNAGIDDIAHQDIQSECLDHPDTPDPAFGYMVLEAHGNDLHIHHINAHYQCCLLYTVEYFIDNFDITASESDTGAPCDCYCYFNLKSIVYDLKSGLYSVALIGIRGDTVGIDTITVGG